MQTQLGAWAKARTCAHGCAVLHALHGRLMRLFEQQQMHLFNCPCNPRQMGLWGINGITPPTDEDGFLE